MEETATRITAEARAESLTGEVDGLLKQHKRLVSELSRAKWVVRIAAPACGGCVGCRAALFAGTWLVGHTRRLQTD